MKCEPCGPERLNEWWRTVAQSKMAEKRYAKRKSKHKNKNKNKKGNKKQNKICFEARSQVTAVKA